jgi:hypothetical protein
MARLDFYIHTGILRMSKNSLSYKEYSRQNKQPRCNGLKSTHNMCKESTLLVHSGHMVLRVRNWGR